MEKTNHNADDLSGEIYDEPPKHSVLSRKEFKPWHHPRKHWVRINQLCHFTRKLIKETHFADDTLRYLTLPGEELLDIQSVGDTVPDGIEEGYEELLDVQALEGAIPPKKATLKLQYLGFNTIGKGEARKALQNYSESIVADSSKVDSSKSKIINGRVQDIARENTLSHKALSENGPFNIINLDLCSSIAAPSGHNQPTYFEAIGKLLEFQRKNMAQPFILFISSRSDIEDADADSVATIMNLVNNNVENYDDFKNRLEELVEQEAKTLIENLFAGNKVKQEDVNRIFGVGLGKWLINLMHKTHWEVSLEDLCCYSVYKQSKKTPNMVSLVFKFTKVNQGMSDDTGLAGNFKEGNPVKTEPELAISMLNQCGEIKDVDQILQNDENLKDKLIEQCGKLLEKIGYSLDEYKDWADSHFQSV